jgi:DNA-binding SARP family transcriptional activator
MTMQRELLAIHLFGGLEIRRGGEVVRQALPTRKSIALLLFLLLHPDRIFSRSYLAGLLWPDATEERARAGLRVALVAIQRLLAPESADRGRIVAATRGEVLLHQAPDLWVDVWEFRRGLDEVRSLPASSPEQREAMELVAGLYRGPLAPDLTEEWAVPLRDSLRDSALACLQNLTRAEEAQQQYTRAIFWAQRALGIDRCAEESHRALMRLYSLLGERANAIHQYHECRRILREDLGASPDEVTQRLFGQLRAQTERPASAPPETAPALPEFWSPLVGREPEMARLRQDWERARSGRGGCLLLAGEAGVGKSRLGRELLQEIAGSGGLVLYGQAREAEDHFLYLPLLDPMRRALHLAEEQQLALCDKVWMAHVARLLPELRGEGNGLLAPGSDTSHLLEALTRFFVVLATQRPLCLFIDDLHWADAATGDFIRYFCHRIRSSRILLLGGYRAGQVPEGSWFHTWLLQVGVATTGPGARAPAGRHEPGTGVSALTLSRLDPDAVMEMLQNLGEEGASEALLRPLGQRLYAETAGNPFFLLEQLRVLFEQGWLEVTDEGRWRIASERLVELGLGTGPITERLPLASSVSAAVQQRVARLLEEDRQLLACAAVIGRHFDFETLRRAVGVEIDTALAGVERLLNAELIRTRADGFDFSHDQIREAVLAGLSPIRRQDLHRRVGEALEATSGLNQARLFAIPLDAYVFRSPIPSVEWARAAEVATRLAHHFREAAPLIGPEKAVRYHLLAGSRARELCAYDRAVSLLEAARDLLEQLTTFETPLALWEQVATHLAPAYRGVGRGEDAYRLLQAHLARCTAAGEPIWIARAHCLLGSLLYIHSGLPGETTDRDCYQAAIAVCEHHGLNDWMPVPMSHLSYLLASRYHEVEKAEALARSAWDRATDEVMYWIGRRLATVLLSAVAHRHDWEAWRSTYRDSLRWGGPWGITLNPILTSMEADCRAAGQTELFQEICRQAKSDSEQAGVMPPFQQWFLEPAPPRVAQPRWQIEEPFTERLHHLTWHDPTGRGRFDLTTRPGWLSLWPAPGANLWPESDLNASRLLVVAGRGDWVAQTRVAMPGTDRIFAGLVVWQDAMNFARLEWERRFRGGPIVQFEACLTGPWEQIGRGCLDADSVWLRLERVGQTLHALCSTDGRNWLTAGSINLPPSEREQVGIHAIVEHGVGPACFEGFWFTSRAANDR